MRRKDHMEVRLGRGEGNNLMVKVFERMMMGEGNREGRNRDLGVSIDLDMTNERSLILRWRSLTAAEFSRGDHLQKSIQRQ